MFHLFEKTDSQIQKDVKNELKWDPSVADTQITVTANNGIVTLRGTVPHYFEKHTAEKAAQRVGGVRAVADEIEVNVFGTEKKSDEKIAEAALNALTWNFQVPDDVKVSVDNGWITLRGETNWAYQKTAATNAVNQMIGVRGVTNEIILKEQVQPSDVKIRIEEALKRSAEREGRKINVAVNGSGVTLSGNVHSYSEIGDAELAAWNAPGVLKVENHLKLTH